MSVDPTFGATEPVYVECAVCSAKLGAPTLCPTCLNLRAAIATIAHTRRDNARLAEANKYLGEQLTAARKERDELLDTGATEAPE